MPVRVEVETVWVVEVYVLTVRSTGPPEYPHALNKPAVSTGVKNNVVIFMSSSSPEIIALFCCLVLLS
ncbi:MAG: hypothetical protein D3914_02990 [Candidatus Electrothrix sp. LOE2]|nr:hypothetical protein [Candidatus Electrothrix sp. LOE2]